MKLLVNIFGQPGAGKSTLAAGLFYKLKLDYIKAELACEVVKQDAYLNKVLDKWHGVDILAENIRQIYTYFLESDVVISDSPLELQKFYNPDLQELPKLPFKEINVLVKRVKPYIKQGRYQTEEDADKIHTFLDINIKRDLDILGNEEGLETLYKHVQNTINQGNI